MPTPHTKVPSHRARTWSGLTTKTQSCAHHILVTFTSPLLAFTVTSATTAAWLLPMQVPQATPRPWSTAWLWARRGLDHFDASARRCPLRCIGRAFQPPCKSCVVQVREPKLNRTNTRHAHRVEFAAFKLAVLQARASAVAAGRAVKALLKLLRAAPLHFDGALRGARQQGRFQLDGSNGFATKRAAHPYAMHHHVFQPQAQACGNHFALIEHVL